VRAERHLPRIGQQPLHSLDLPLSLCTHCCSSQSSSKATGLAGTPLSHVTTARCSGPSLGPGRMNITRPAPISSCTTRICSPYGVPSPRRGSADGSKSATAVIQQPPHQQGVVSVGVRHHLALVPLACTQPDAGARVPGVSQDIQVLGQLLDALPQPLEPELIGNRARQPVDRLLLRPNL